MKRIADADEVVVRVPVVVVGVEVEVALGVVLVHDEGITRAEPTVQNSVHATTPRILLELNRIWKRYFPTILYRVSSFLELYRCALAEGNTRRDSGFFGTPRFQPPKAKSLTVDCFVYSPKIVYHKIRFPARDWSQARGRE